MSIFSSNENITELYMLCQESCKAVMGWDEKAFANMWDTWHVKESCNYGGGIDADTIRMLPMSITEWTPSEVRNWGYHMPRTARFGIVKDFSAILTDASLDNDFLRCVPEMGGNVELVVAEPMYIRMGCKVKNLRIRGSMYAFDANLNLDAYEFHEAGFGNKHLDLSYTDITSAYFRLNIYKSGSDTDRTFVIDVSHTPFGQELDKIYKKLQSDYGEGYYDYGFNCDQTIHNLRNNIIFDRGCVIRFLLDNNYKLIMCHRDHTDALDFHLLN